MKTIPPLSRAIRFVAAVCSALVIFVVNDAAAQSDKIPGISLGSFKVNNNGAGTYTIPIIVPPGINGMAPKLSLAYNSQSQNSLLGTGWSLTGIPAIHRCPRTIAQDNFKGAITFDVNDRFCLDQQRLMVVNGTYGANLAEYRTEIDTFVKVISYGQVASPGSGPLYFVVKTKNGDTMEFGGNATSTMGRIEAQAKTTVRVWALNKITDTSGNSMTITYEEDSTNGDYRPSRIDYTTNPVQGVTTALRSVQFTYEDRPDKTPLYIGGSLVKVMKRLTKIQTNAPPPQSTTPALTREYRFTYEVGLATSRSRLKTITECGWNSATGYTCLPQHVLTSQEGANGAHHAAPQGAKLADWARSWSGDFNGDGKTDMVGEFANKLQFAFFNSDGGYQLTPIIGASTYWPFCTKYVGDFNGDGKADFACDNGTKIFFVFSNGDGTIQTTDRVNLPIDWNPSNVFVGDFNGDGRADLASFGSGSKIVLALSNGDGTIQMPTPVIPSYLWSTLYPIRVGDFNGDGKSDFAMITNKVYFLFSNGDGTFDNPVPAGSKFSTLYWASDYIWVGDFNGDGKADLASTNGRIQVLFSTGDGTIATGATNPNPPFFYSPSIHPGDFNGDGRTDFLSQDANWYCAFSNGDGTFRFQLTPHTPAEAAGPGAFVGDFNGDGISDLLALDSGYEFETTFLDGPFPDLATSINNNLGGKIDIVYKPITDPSIYTRDNDSVYPVMDVQAHISRIPTYLVDSHTAKTRADGSGKNFKYTYDYGGAKIHLLGRGGLGFRFMRVQDETAIVDPSNPQVKRQTTNFFNQVDPNTHLVAFPKIGLLDFSETVDTLNPSAPFAQVHNTYATTNTFPTVVFPALTAVDRSECDKQPACLQTRDEFTFDTFGNLTLTHHLGDVSDLNDQRDEVTDWITDTTNWVHRPKRMVLRDSTGATVREKWFYYDGRNDPSQFGQLGTPPRGLLTKEESRGIPVTTPDDHGNPANPFFIYTYDDGFGNRTSVKDPIDCLTSTVYDTATHTFPDTVTNCAGHVSVFKWDPRFGARVSEQDPNHTPTNRVITDFVYDSLGRLTKTTLPIDYDQNSPNGSVSFNYNNLGNPTTQHIQTKTTKDHGGSTTIDAEAFFDGLGRFYRNESDAPGGATIVEKFTFDSRGLQTEKFAHQFATETSLLPTTFVYDVLGRQTFMIRPDGRMAENQYLPGEVTMIDENLHEKTKTVDGYGQMIRMEEKSGVETFTTLYDYDAAGQLTHVENHLGHHTRMKYDVLGRKTAMCDPNMGAGPNVTTCDTTTPGAWLYTYDKAGNLLTQADAVLRSLSQQLSFQYDQLSRLTIKTYPNNDTITNVYDQGTNGKGRLTHVTDLGGVVTDLTYDKQGRTVQTDRTIDTPRTLTQTYNALGKVLTESITDNGVPGELFDFTYDEAGRLNSVPGYVSSILYNARGQKDEIHYTNNVTTTFDYFDQAGPGQKTNFKLKNRTTNGTNPDYLNLQNLDYDYDNGSNMTSIIDHVSQTGSRYPLVYDDLNRLIEASGNFGGTNQSQITCPYAYSAIGDVLNKCGIAYTYGDANHPSFVTATSDGNTYAPDLNGNTLTGASRIFAWTADNRAASITTGTGPTTMDYDYTGARVKKFGPVTFGLTVYPFPGYEIESDGTKIKYISLGTELLAANKSSGEKMFYHNDHLGGVNVITDINGARTELMEYDPWGKLSRQETTGNAVDPTHGFTGQERDEETDLYYYGGRYYDQNLARFIQPDPFVSEPDDPQSLNRYSYVLNNPYRYIDPTGYEEGSDEEEEEEEVEEDKKDDKLNDWCCFIELRRTATPPPTERGTTAGGRGTGPEGRGSDRDVVDDGAVPGGSPTSNNGSGIGTGSTGTAGGIAAATQHEGFMKQVAEYTERGLRRAARSFRRNIKEHIEALADPKQVDAIKHHLTELRTFRAELNIVEREALRRGITLGIGAIIGIIVNELAFPDEVNANETDYLNAAREY